MIIINDKILKIFNIFLKGIVADGITVFPFIIFSSKTKITPELINHEKIHLKQQLELLIIPFYIWYFIEYYTKGYKNVSFEKEAYQNESDFNYLKKRKLFNFRKYINEKRL